MTAPGSPEIKPPARVILWLLSVYKLLLSQLFTGSCRFVPSCSTYAVEAVARHGALRGSWFAVLRVGRCHPLCRGGLDQVPVSRSSTDGATGS